MPLYEYRCEACGERSEVIRKFSDPPLEVCARCGKGPIERLQSSPAIQFKGAGWYITDYAQKDRKAPPDGEGKTPAADPKAKDTPSGDTSAKTESGSAKTESGSAKTEASSAKTDTSNPSPAPTTNKTER